jgi:hypothetical protein
LDHSAGANIFYKSCIKHELIPVEPEQRVSMLQLLRDRIKLCLPENTKTTIWLHSLSLTSMVIAAFSSPGKGSKNLPHSKDKTLQTGFQPWVLLLTDLGKTTA